MMAVLKSTETRSTSDQSFNLRQLSTPWQLEATTPHPSLPALRICTYVRWFARPTRLRQPGLLVMRPLSARRMRTLLRFRMVSHSLPTVLGRRTGVPLAQRLCQRCAICM